MWQIRRKGLLFKIFPGEASRSHAKGGKFWFVSSTYVIGEATFLQRG